MYHGPQSDHPPTHGIANFTPHFPSNVFVLIHLVLKEDMNLSQLLQELSGGGQIHSEVTICTLLLQCDRQLPARPVLVYFPQVPNSYFSL